MTYDAKNFGDLAETPLGKELWRLLTSPIYIHDMKKATKAKLPAVALIGDDLLEELGEQVKERRVKQMVGHMTRQIMEGQGYVLDAQNVRITCDKVFVSGSRYKKFSTAPQAVHAVK